VYWLVRAAGTNRGFQGCVQLLSVNGKMIDMRPWPLGKALSGADVGKCNSVQSLISAKPLTIFLFVCLFVCLFWPEEKLSSHIGLRGGKV